MNVKISRGGSVKAGGKLWYFGPGMLQVPDNIAYAFAPFQDGLDILSEWERKLLNQSGFYTKESVLAVEDLTTVKGIGDKTAKSILEKLNGNIN